MDLIIGGLAGAISRTLTAPFELLKIQEQNKFVPNTTLKDVIRKEGFRGLWKGNLSNCVRIFPQMAVNYATFNYVNVVFESYIENKQVNHFLSGAVAGMVAMTSVYPLENIRSRLSLQTNNNHYSGIIDVFRKTPLPQLYNGLRMSLIGFAPYNALNFMFYNAYNSHINDLMKEYWFYNQTAVHLIAGGLSGISAVTITYPTDLIRRRLQIQGFDKSVPKYEGIVDCVGKIVRSEGARGLYRGLIPCYMKIFPANAIQFYVIWLCKEYFVK